MSDNHENNINISVTENSDGSYFLQINGTLSKEELSSLNEDFSYIDEAERDYYDVDPYDDEGAAMAAGHLASAKENILRDLNLSELASDVSKICDKELIDTILDVMKRDGTYKKDFDNLSLKELLETAKFDSDQINEIRYGLEAGLSTEQVLLYANPELDSLQMFQIRFGLECGLSEEQVSLYAKPEFNCDQMEQIRWGFEEGLSMEQAAVYAKPEFDCDQMNEIKIGFEHGLSIEQVSLYANPEFSLELMSNFREALEKEYLKGNSLDSMIDEAREECKAENANVTAQRNTQEKTAPGDDGAI